MGDSAQDWYFKGMDLASQDHHEEAIQAYKEALKIDPTYTWVWVYMGMSLSQLGRHEEELQAYDKSLEIDPDFIFGWVYKAYCLDDLSRNEEAIEAYKRTLELLQHTEIPAYERYKGEVPYALGNLYFKMGKYEEAIEKFEQAIRDGTYSSGTVEYIRTLIDIAKKRLEAGNTSQGTKDDSFIVTVPSAKPDFQDKTMVSGNISHFQKSFQYQSGMMVN